MQVCRKDAVSLTDVDILVDNLSLKYESYSEGGKGNWIEDMILLILNQSTSERGCKQNLQKKGNAMKKMMMKKAWRK